MMKLTETQLRKMCDNQDSPYIRCAGFLYIRYGLAPVHCWEWMKDYFADDFAFPPGEDNDRTITIGEYCQNLLTEDKYYNTVLPRLPVKYRTLFGERLMLANEHRKRYAANKAILDTFKMQNLKVEACTNGDWLHGHILEVQAEVPSRIMVRVKLDDLD